MGKKRDRANENIIMLIDEIIELKKELYYGQCIWEHSCIEDEDCYSCKERRYEEMRQRMESNFVVL